MVNLLKTLLAGALLSATFPPLNLWFLAPISIAIFYKELLSANFRKRSYISILYGIFFFAPLLHWSSIFVGALPWLILAFGESFFFAIFAIFRWRQSLQHYFRFAAIWVLIEFAREKFPFGGFGWGRIGFAQIDSPLSFYLPLIGVTGLGFLTVLFTLLFTDNRMRQKSFYVFITIVLLGFAIEVKIDQRIGNETDGTLQATLIQGGVPEANLNFNSVPMAVFNKHYLTTEKFLTNSEPKSRPTDLIIWPENASDLDPFKNPEIDRKIQLLRKQSSADLLIGAVLDNSAGPQNAAILYRSNGSISRYVKRDLAPFGEYIPLRNLAEKISPLAKNVTNFLPGEEKPQLVSKTAIFTPLICFELLDDQTTTENAAGNNLLISMTNNATFGRSAEAAQQFLIARVRAYELRKATAVVSTTGFTGFLNNKGGVVSKANQFTSTSLSSQMNLNNYDTPISKHRNLPEIVIAGIFIVTLMRRKNG